MINKKRVVIVMAATILLIFVASTVNDAFLSRNWISQSLGGTPGEDGFYQMAFNSKGELQLVYLGESNGHYALMYGQKLGENWNLTFVSRLFYEHEGASLALDSRDNVFMCTHAYHEVYGTNLRSHILYFAHSGENWTGSIINTTGHCSSAEVAVDDNDVVHLFYTESVFPGYYENFNPYTRLVDMVSTQQGWNVNVLKNISGDQYLQIDDLVRGPDGSIFVLYSRVTGYESGPEVTLTHLNLSVISSGTVSDSEILVTNNQLGGEPSLCVDAAGNAYVAYYWRSGSTSNGTWHRICYSTNALGNWTRTYAAYGGDAWPGGTAIAVDSQNNVHIAYFVEGLYGPQINHSVRYCTNRDGDWNVRIVDSCMGLAGEERVALLVDARGGIHMTYFQRNVGKHGEVDLAMYTTDKWEPHDYGDVLTESGWRAFLVGCVIGIALYSGWAYQERRARPKPPTSGMAG